MASFSVSVDKPGFDSVVVIETIWSCMESSHRDQLFSGWLHVTSLICAARLQRYPPSHLHGIENRVAAFESAGIASTIRPNVSATPTCVTAPPVVSSITIAPVTAKTRANVPMNSAARRFTLCPQRNVLRRTNRSWRESHRERYAFLQALLVRAGEFGRIVQRPVQSAGDSWNNRTTFTFGFATHRHHELEYLSRLPNVENAL